MDGYNFQQNFTENYKQTNKYLGPEKLLERLFVSKRKIFSLEKSIRLNV